MKSQHSLHSLGSWQKILSPSFIVVLAQGRYIAVAASLNGGNALAAFVRMIQLWCVELGCSVPQEKIWNTALTAGIRETEVPSIVTSPTILGERHNPDEKGSVTNINQVRIMLMVLG